MKKNTIIAGAAIAAVAGTVAYLLLKRRKEGKPLIEEFDTHYSENIVPNVKRKIKHVTNTFKNAKNHLQEGEYVL